jgi:sugar lactone lactonase YvrE
MKRIIFILCVLCAFVGNIAAQNVGINNTNPQAALDLQGDLRLRSAILTLPANLNNDVDLTTVKSTVYMFAGGALTGCQITGFTGGVDGRIVTIFNNSTTNAVQLYDANFSISPSAAANKILTGTGSNAVIYGNGSVTLRYDGAKQKWIVMSSAYTDGLSTTVSSGGPWTVTGNNISNNNTGNVGLGTNTPTKKLEINSGAVNQSGLRLTQYASNATDVNVTDVFADATSPTGLAFDNVGNCYAANFNDNKIYKITPAGVVSDFVTTNLNGPHDIVLGPDGNLYVSNFFGGTISRITLAGAIVTFATGFSNPIGLAFDNSGYLFVVNNSNGQLSKVSPSLTIPVPAALITYNFGTGLTSPYGCVFSITNDKIYIANYGADEIAEINFLFGGAKATFKSGINACTGINIDATGNLYVAQAAPNKVVKITPAGVVTDYATTTYPFDITFNNGKLYMANQTTNKVSVLNAVSNFLAVDNTGEVVRIKAGNLLQTTGQAFANSWTVAGNNISNNNTGNVGIGTSTPNAKLAVQGDINLFGTPLFYSNLFNDYGGGGLKIFNSGDGKSLRLDGSTIQSLNFGGFIPTTGSSPLFINPFGGRINIGTAVSNNARVAIKRGTYAAANDGSLALIGTTYTSFFHYGVNEDTYIRGGKDGSNVIISDAEGGSVGIGTSTPDVNYKLSVNGSIRSKEVVVETGWADYVFDEKYRLRPLSEIEKFIKENKHLPEIPSAKEIQENGLKVGEIQTKMMQKIEELTLYIIELKKEIDLLKAKNK